MLKTIIQNQNIQPEILVCQPRGLNAVTPGQHNAGKMCGLAGGLNQKWGCHMSSLLLRITEPLLDMSEQLVCLFDNHFNP